jgi:hypothetical protein
MFFLPMLQEVAATPAVEVSAPAETPAAETPAVVPAESPMAESKVAEVGVVW